MQTMVRFEHVSKRYNLGLTRTSIPVYISRWAKSIFSRNNGRSFESGHIWALRDINFSIGEGQSLALIGPNGAGKTTILKLLAKITKPTTGRIETNGKLSALIELGAGFHPELTGRENIYLNGTILGLKRKEIEQRFDEIVDFSELERFMDTPVKRYSSGMNVRLGFAVAACIRPNILLVDEVLAVGDASFRQKCINRINELIESGTSIIFVSHNLWLVQAVCPLAIFIDKGEVIYNGRTSEAINLYDRAISERRIEQLETANSRDVGHRSEVEISKIEVLDSSGTEAEELRFDQPAEVKIHYLAYRSFEDVNVVVRIIRSDGVTCCMLRSKLDDVEIDLPRGTGVISLVLDPLQLRGGTFYLEIMFRDSQDIKGLISKYSDWFYVAGNILTSNEMNGVFEPNRRWLQVPLEQLEA